MKRSGILRKMPLAGMVAAFMLLTGCGRDSSDASPDAGEVENPASLDSAAATPNGAGQSAASGGGRAPAAAVELPSPDASPSDSPEVPVSGTLFGREFKPDQVELERNGVLTFKEGEDFIPEAQVKLFLFLDEGESFVEKEWNVSPDGPGIRNPHVHVHAKPADSDDRKTEIYMRGYRLQLEFEKAPAFQLAGRIRLTLPDDGEISGTFQVEEPDDPSQPPGDRHKPFIHGRIVFEPKVEDWLTAGYTGLTKDGERQGNMAGTKVGPEKHGGWAESTTFEPRITRLDISELPFKYRHVRVEPGTYLVYVKRGETYVAGRWVDVEPESGLELAFELQPEAGGSLEVAVPAEGPKASVSLLPLDGWGELLGGMDDSQARSLAYAVDLKGDVANGQARFDALHPGHYRVFFAKESRDVRIVKGETASVTF